jgi:5-methylcytosine-specific restriction endonuclease McrA
MELLISNWLSDLNGRNQNTYKFALQLAIIDQSNKSKMTYEQIATSFAERYWNNVVAYNLRETININKAPYFHKAILEIADEHNLEGLFYTHAKKKVKGLSTLVVEKLTGGYNATLQNPISRLQSNSDTLRTGTGSNSGTGWLYSWNSKDEVILFNKEMIEQVYLHRELLKKLTVFHWALFIERYNQAPSVTNKLLDAKKSRALKKIVRELVIDFAGDKCFYCKETPETVEIDHFIPFAFLFDNPVWDLVYSCKDCNSGKGGKFEKLPPQAYLQELFSRNKKIFKSNSKLFEGFESLTELEEHIQKTYQSCINAGFRKWEVVQST